MSSQEKRRLAPTSTGHAGDRPRSSAWTRLLPPFPHLWPGVGGTSHPITRPRDRLDELTRGELSVEQMLSWGAPCPSHCLAPTPFLLPPPHLILPLFLQSS